MSRGDIWWVSGGVYASKPRPAVIIQDDRFSETDSVTVCPFTSTVVDAPLLRYRVEAAPSNGLEVDSDIMVDKVTTVRRSNLIRSAGNLTARQVVEVDRLLMVFLGLAG